MSKMLDIKDITNTIIQGDCLDVMKQMPDNCVDLTVTSPPYDNLRDYKGFVFDFEGIAQQLYRVTKTGGVVVWVVGDATINGSESGTSFRQALYFKEIGFNLHDTMIYAKNNPMPLTHNRYEQQFEYMFVLSKGKPKTFNALTQKTKGAGKTYNWGGTNDYGDKSAKRDREEVSTVKAEKYRFNIWYMDVANSKYTNSAPFPESLVKDHLLSWSNEGEVILEPFAGSGTTPAVSNKFGRNYIGIEISPEYCEIARKRVQEAKDSMGLFT